MDVFQKFIFLTCTSLDLSEHLPAASQVRQEARLVLTRHWCGSS